jgi:hypothetical protein
MYCASKHAIKGFTDALRMELEETKAPISVTLVKPAGVDTPFAEHAANFLEHEPALPPPLYEPEDVAQAILHAATHPKRDVYVGSAAKMMSAQNRIAPRVNDWFAEHFLVGAQQKDKPAAAQGRGTLYEPGTGLRVHGDNDRMAHPSVYTRLSLHPVLAAAALATVGLGVAGLVSRGALTDGSARVARRVVSRAIRYAREAAHA